MAHALVLEKSPEQAKEIRDILLDVNINCTIVSYGHDALEKAQNSNFDIFILDAIRDPFGNMDGFSICREIRKNSQNPIIIITSELSDGARRLAYESGADRYITKPIHQLTLELTVKAMLRLFATKHTHLKVGRIVIDQDSREVFIDGDKKYLTQTEFSLLNFLAKNENKAMSRESILDTVWGWSGCLPTSTVNVHIKNLRDKIGEDIIETIHGYGYRLNTN